MAISYTINAGNYTSSPSFSCLVGDSVNIAGYKASTLTGYGISSSSSVLPGCSYSTVIGTLRSMSGTASTRGTYSFAQQKVSSGKYTSGGTLTITVKATWYQKIFFDANGGSGAPSTQSWSTTSASQPSASSRTISSTVPTREYYTFKGWNDSSTATAAVYQPGGTIGLSWSTSSSVGTTLYAVWWGNWTARLNYFHVGGTGGPDNEISTVVQYYQPSAKVFVVSSLVPVKEGYEFMGWDENRHAEIGSIHAGDTISVDYRVDGSSYKSLYAIWKEKTSPVKVNRGGTWVDGTTYVRRNGSWVEPTRVYGKVGGEWK